MSQCVEAYLLGINAAFNHDATRHSVVTLTFLCNNLLECLDIHMASAWKAVPSIAFESHRFAPQVKQLRQIMSQFSLRYMLYGVYAMQYSYAIVFQNVLWACVD